MNREGRERVECISQQLVTHKLCDLGQLLGSALI